MKRTIIILLLYFFCAFSSAENTAELEYLNEINHLKTLKNDLVSEIISANKIIIVEHSDSLDFEQKADREQKMIPELIYQTVELTPKSKAKLIKSIKSKVFKPVYTLCAFSPHHRIELYKDDLKMSDIEICFQCTDIKWSKDNHVHADLSNIFSDVVASSGLHEKRDWRYLTQEHDRPNE